MAVVQTTYTQYQRPGLEGMFASEWGSALVSETRDCETAAGIAFGRAVSQGPSPKGCIVGGTAAGFLGVTIRDITLVPVAPNTTVDRFYENQNVGILNAGDIWLIAVNGCTAGAAATFDAATGQFNPAAAGIAIPHSRWLTTAAAGGLAVLRLTSTNP